MDDWLNKLWTWENIVKNFYNQTINSLNEYLPKIIWSIIILIVWAIISYLIYKLVIYFFKKFKLLDLIDKIEEKMDVKVWKEELNSNWKEKHQLSKSKKKKLTEKINVDEITAKSISSYIFLIFFRYSIIIIWITEVEKFLNDVINYLPNLFIAVCVWFFGISFSDTVYNIVYYTLEITKHQTSKVIAMWAKLVILFFTIMIVLNYIKIIDQFFINTLFVWFVWAITVWVWISFWLWWKDVARQILESFKR